MGPTVNTSYTKYHPEWYRRRIPLFWWLRKYSYIKFIGRELTSLFVAYSVLLLLAQTWALGRGEEAYDRLASVMQLRPVAYFHVLVLIVVLFHAITWLNLAPQALVVRLAGRRVPDRLVLLGHYAAWLAASALVVWLLLVR